MEGMFVTYPECNQTIELLYEAGQSIGPSNYDMNFKDFCGLLRTCKSRTGKEERVKRIIDNFFHCDMKLVDGGVKLVSNDGSFFPLEIAHISIQTHKDIQFELYQAAMDMWR